MIQQKTVEVPQVHYTDNSVDAPVVSVQSLQRTVKVPQVQF